MRSMYLPLATYGLLVIFPPSAYWLMPSTFGSSTHSTASTYTARYHSWIRFGSTPTSWANRPVTISRWMWCA